MSMREIFIPHPTFVLQELQEVLELLTLDHPVVLPALEDLRAVLAFRGA